MTSLVYEIELALAFGHLLKCVFYSGRKGSRLDLDKNFNLKDFTLKTNVRFILGLLKWFTKKFED